MNEEQEPQFQNVPAPLDDTDDAISAASSEGGERIFDISEDSISPIHDEPAPVPATPPIPPPPKPAAFSGPLGAATAPIPAAPLENSRPEQSPKPRPAIPLQDFSATLIKARSGPANPPAKTIFSHLAGTEEESAPAAATNLQSAVASILPSNLKGQKEKAKTSQPMAVPANPNLKPLRTYEGDVAEVLAHKRTSTASIALAESRKQEGEERISTEETEKPSSHAGKKIFLLAFSILLLAGGAAIAYYLYSVSPLAPLRTIIQEEPVLSALVPRDSQSLISINNLSPLDIQTRLQGEMAKPQAAHSIREIILTQSGNGQMTRVSGPEAVTAMDIDTPEMLSRSLTAPWMFGIYQNDAGERSVFVMATTDFFQNAFAGMLQWESVMADDLKQYFYPASVRGVANILPAPTSTVQALDPLAGINSILPPTEGTAPVSTSTAATSTRMRVPANGILGGTSSMPVAEEAAPVQPYFTIRGRFEDRIVKNKDVRVFRTVEGNTLFLYSFIDNAKLVMTDREETLVEILERLEKQAFVR